MPNWHGMMAFNEGGLAGVRQSGRNVARELFVRSIFIPVLLLAGAFLVSGPALAQPDPGPGLAPGMSSRLAAERISAVTPGLYSAGDDTFTLEAYSQGKYLLRFPRVPEKFVLTQERSSLGARILKYDTGAAALRVSVWGGMTLYTQDNPGGIPATRLGDAPLPGPMNVSAGELLTAFGDEANHLTYAQKIAVKFSADPAVMAADAETRGRAFDALTNAAIGIERFLASLPVARSLFAKRVNAVKVAEGGKPTITLTGQTLLVSFVPGEGHEGHASSLAIQQELGKLLALTPKDMATK